MSKKPQPTPLVVQPAPIPNLGISTSDPVVDNPVAADPAPELRIDGFKVIDAQTGKDFDLNEFLNATPMPLVPGPPATPIPGTMHVKIQHLSDRAKTPTYGSAGAACFDLYAADTLAVAPGRSAVVPTDLAFEVPEGYVLMIYSRSGHGFKHGVRLANNTGVVDSDYRGHVPVCLHNDGRDVFYVHQGDRVAQAMIVPVPRVEFEVVDELSSTERGENGFGSTGR